ncbi:MAG TPA: AAA family ATPase [Burkholderiales bacterium]|nr:AAA family ATPase [Burkholderiales bacterium]
MYYEFFGLSHAPFKITPDTDVFFEGGNRGAILEALIYAITHGEGIIKVTGEVGSGKTMLCRVLQTRLPANIETVYLANPSVSPDEILHAIAFEMQLRVPRDASRLEVMHALNEYLVERHSQQRQVVLFVEESQGMPISTLEEIRLLSNLETRHHKLLQIVLFGQPELDDNLRQQNIRQLRERITHSFHLLPLDAEDARAYLNFRLQAAGYRGPDLFNRRVTAYMSRACNGLTRRLNLVADKALLAAFAEGTHNVSLEHVKAAVRDSEFSSVEVASNGRPITYAVAGLALGGILGVGAFALYQAFNSAKDAPIPAAASSATPAAVETTPPVAASAPVVAAAAVPAVEPPPAVAASADILEQRLLAMDQWLGEQKATSFSIQLLGSDDPELLREYFKTIAKYLEIEKVYVYRTTANRHPSMTVLYGTFATRDEVTRTLQNLPDELKFNRPYYRTIQGIRAEIARQRS